MNTFDIDFIRTSQSQGKSLKIVIATILLILLSITNLFGQQTIRRYFIIAYDVSTPFINAENNCPEYERALRDLFSNRKVYNFNEENNSNINIEKKNGVPFFDPEHDEIGFLHFNISESEIKMLRKSSKGESENEIVDVFSKTFLKDKHINWTTYSATGNVMPSDYIRYVLSITPTPQYFGKGVSLSNFVYPLVLDKIESTKYAEEYILILLSDFRTGSMLGNTQDLNRVRDIYGGDESKRSSPDYRVTYIKKRIDDMSSQFYKVDFFQYSFISANTGNPIGIIGYKIKPKVGQSTPEDVSIFVDGDLRLEQQGYKNEIFKTSETKIKFTHNDKLFPFEIRMKIFMPLENGRKIIFDDVVEYLDEAGKWKSKYTDDNDLMRFDKSNHTYIIPAYKISVDKVINEKNFKSLVFEYQVKAKYDNGITQPLSFIFQTPERELTLDHVYYSTKATFIIMIVLLSFILILGLCIFFVHYIKPKGLVLKLYGYADSYEKIDYRKFGKLRTAYKVWDSEKKMDDNYMLVEGFIEHKSPQFVLNWNMPINLKLIVENIPSDFEMFIKLNAEDSKEFDSGDFIEINNTKQSSFKFWVGIRQKTKNTILEPVLVKFKLEAVINDSIYFKKSEIRKIEEHSFHLGPDLGEVWVGIDPGTTGSCVAVGSEPKNIRLAKSNTINPTTIIPSVLAFNKAYDYHSIDKVVSEKAYKHGQTAEGVYRKKLEWRGFRSIKKLLGYDNEKKIIFKNRETLKLKGKELAALLVKGLYKDTKIFFSQDGVAHDEYKKDGVFNPLRAVVAIPNNFTATKIQDMVDCVESLKQFKEIRYVYEAEAVLFYYMYNKNKFSNNKSNADAETILVFDMGGATINATVVTVKKTENNSGTYNIDILGKIGYGIGGETIDYCIVKFILSFVNDYPGFSSIDIFDKSVELGDLAFKIKKEIVDNYYSNNSYLITFANLEEYINGALGLSITINEDSDIYSYFKKSDSECKLLQQPMFVNTIYSNVEDAVKEVVGLSDNVHIDKVIFSGRSTSFPLIKEKVEMQIKQNEKKPQMVKLDFEESKIAVSQGACWYGINKNLVILNRKKTSATFGFKRTLSANPSDLEFMAMIKMGAEYDKKKENGILYTEESVRYADVFNADSNKVNFYQVMGEDAEKILSENKKHKFSKVASVKVDLQTYEITMRVSENDIVDGTVELNSRKKEPFKGIVADQQIEDGNEEHYTWFVKK